MSIEKEYIHRFMNEMAQRQGTSGTFTYWTLDNEYESHVPHVHVCVPASEKKWLGKAINAKYKTVCAVRLNQTGYSLSNLEFEHVVSGNVFSNADKKEIVDWLNASDPDHPELRNWQLALRDYKRSNEV